MSTDYPIIEERVKGVLYLQQDQIDLTIVGCRVFIVEEKEEEENGFD